VFARYQRHIAVYTIVASSLPIPGIEPDHDDQPRWQCSTCALARAVDGQQPARTGQSQPGSCRPIAGRGGWFDTMSRAGSYANPVAV
jgi:hypothetical protein